ncbi:MAG: cyclic nucleotide-binding domain-containing protein [Candidatus Eisenbacteria bacterium]
MISTELLRYYSYFAGVDGESLKAVAAISEEVSIPAGQTLFKEGDPAKALYIVTNGQVDVSLQLGSGREIVVDQIVPGDLLGWSVFVEPHKMRATAIARKESKAVAINAAKLRDLCEKDTRLGFNLVKQVAGSLAHRLSGAVTKIAAAD